MEYNQTVVSHPLKLFMMAAAPLINKRMGVFGPDFLTYGSIMAVLSISTYFLRTTFFCLL